MDDKEKMEEKSAKEKDLKEAGELAEKSSDFMKVPSIVAGAAKVKAKEIGRTIKRHWENR